MSRPARALPDELGDAFAVHAALERGVSAARLRSVGLERPFHGVRMLPETPHVLAAFNHDSTQRAAIERKAKAFEQVMSAGWFFAGSTAAVLFGAPVVHCDELVVAAIHPADAPRRRGVRAIKVSKHLVAVSKCAGMRVSSPASTWAMLGAELTVRQLVAVGDMLVRVPRTRQGFLMLNHELATVDQLQAALDAGRRIGASRLRQALEQIRVGCASPLETDYRLDAAAAGLPEPELDVEIFDRRGRRIGITEFVYREFGTLVEVEGDHHRTDRKQWNRDIEKYSAYVAEGWEVVRLTSAHIRGPHPRATAIVRDALTRHGWVAT
ncbi:hypothetical protein [Microbacterium marmarense]|uniref:DUF559 domain-containing protein n=1 Tax=Microbacterium marmarense TaxID=3122051 RepID=A0ABU8LSH1_9MICO